MTKTPTHLCSHGKILLPKKDTFFAVQNRLEAGVVGYNQARCMPVSLLPAWGGTLASHGRGRRGLYSFPVLVASYPPIAAWFTIVRGKRMHPSGLG